MTASARRLIVYYAILAVVAVVVVVVVFTAGSDEKPQPSIAGGYDVAPPAARCTGLQMDITQSGQFVALRKPDGKIISRARLEDGRVTGDVNCVNGGQQALVASIAVKGVLAGRLGGRPLRAARARRRRSRATTRSRRARTASAGRSSSRRPAATRTRSRAAWGGCSTATARSRGASPAATRARAPSPDRRSTAA